MLITPLHQALTFVTVGYAAWMLDPGSRSITLVAAPLMTVSSRYFGRQLKERARWNREAQARLLGFVHQTLTSMPIVHAYSAEERNVDAIPDAQSTTPSHRRKEASSRPWASAR